MDAQKTDLPDDSIDFFYSNNTLEHIPTLILPCIMKDVYRVIKPGGIASIAIDYGDHWSYADKSITPYNYLKYDSKTWKKYNPSLHYQNRLRHSDYLAIINEAGFEIVSETVVQGTESAQAQLRQMNIASEFSAYSWDDLSIINAWIVAKKTG